MSDLFPKEQVYKIKILMPEADKHGVVTNCEINEEERVVIDEISFLGRDTAMKYLTEVTGLSGEEAEEYIDGLPVREDLMTRNVLAHGDVEYWKGYMDYKDDLLRDIEKWRNERERGETASRK
jgi:hypothetical protein